MDRLDEESLPLYFCYKRVNLSKRDFVFVKEPYRLPIGIEELSDAVSFFMPKRFIRPIISRPRMTIIDLTVRETDHFAFAEDAHVFQAVMRFVSSSTDLTTPSAWS